MCTAATICPKDLYFGRTLDHEESYKDEVTITPRNYVFNFLHAPAIKSHYAIIGMAMIYDNYPLYYDAMNECGLCIAGLNFVGNAVYGAISEDPATTSVAQFEFLPWLLSQCKSVANVRELMSHTKLCDGSLIDGMPAAQLHWIVSDHHESITIESVKDGIKIYDNPFGVLTNNPSFDKQVFQMNNYRNLSVKNPENTLCPEIELSKYCLGLGALGLPGDLSSESRFARVAFTKLNSIIENPNSEEECVNQFFHILGSVDQTRGVCMADNGKYQVTFYTSCCNADKGIYYYTTYSCHRINAIDMHKVDLDSSELFHYETIKEESIFAQN